MKKQLALLVVVLCMAGGAVEAEAVNAAHLRYCSAYAKRAVAHDKNRRYHKCSFPAPLRGVWSNSTAYHFRWCQSKARSVVAAREREMIRRITLCRGCVAYAKASVQAHLANLGRRCRLRTPGWHANYAKHYQWCVRRGVQASRVALQGRQRVLQRCLAGSKVRECNSHTAEAMRLKARVQRQGCTTKRSRVWNFTQASYRRMCMTAEFGTARIKTLRRFAKQCDYCIRWSQDIYALQQQGRPYGCKISPLSSHAARRNWCLAAPFFKANNERIAARKRLHACRCTSYARRAIQQSQANRSLRCGYPGGGMWNSNFQHHYRWCVRVPWSRAASGDRVRVRLLQQCRLRRRR